LDLKGEEWNDIILMEVKKMNEKIDNKDLIVKVRDMNEITEPNGFAPEIMVAQGQRVAKILMQIVDARKDKVIIKGKTFLQFQDWQLVAKLIGHTTATVEWTKPIMQNGICIGWECKASAINKEGEVLSQAESACLRAEKNWVDKDEFQLRSMAQTRACAKVLRNLFSLVVVLAGYEATPAEEMTDETLIKKTEFKPICEECGKNVDTKIINYSAEHYGKILCRECQKKV
jgi:hypothetical protein